MHSRGPTESYFYVWEPRCGYLHKVKKCTSTPSVKRANGAIILENGLVPPNTIPLGYTVGTNLFKLIKSFDGRISDFHIIYSFEARDLEISSM